MAHSQSELQVITHAKNLLNYMMTITQKSPKQFRFSLVGRMQEYVLNIVEELYYANDIFVSPNSSVGWVQRQAHQRKAMSTLKLLVYVAQVSMEQGLFCPSSISRSASRLSMMKTCLAHG